MRAEDYDPNLPLEIDLEVAQELGVAAWYPGWPAGSDRLYDLSVNRIHGAFVNSPSWRDPPPNGFSSVACSNSGSRYVSIGNSSPLNPGTSDYSYGCWFRCSETGTNSRILFQKRDTTNITNAGWNLALNSGVIIPIHCDGAGSNRILFSASGTYRDGLWHHVLVTCRRTSTMEAYVDGVSRGSISIATQAGNVTNSVTATIGVQVDAGLFLNTITGDLTDATFFRKSFSPTQAVAYFESLLTGHPLAWQPSTLTMFLPLSAGTSYFPAASADDGHWIIAPGADVLDNSNTIVICGDDGEGSVLRGFVRFPAFGPGAGATIDSAVVKLSNVSAGVAVDVEVYAFDEDNSAQVASRTDADARSLTTAFGTYAATGSEANAVIEIDVSDVVQEIVDRGGWSASNAIQLVFKTDELAPATFTFASYDDSEPEPELIVSWTEGAGGITAELPVALLEFAPVTPTTSKAAAVNVGLIDYLGVTPNATRSITLAPALVDLSAVTPATTKRATTGIGLTEFASIAPTTIKITTLAAVTVDLLGITPGTAKTAGLTPCVVEFVGLSPTFGSSADVGPVAIEFAAVAPATSKAAAVGVALVDLTSVAPQTQKSVAVGVGLVDLTGVTPAVAKSITLTVGLLELVGVAPGTVHVAAVPVGLVEFVTTVIVAGGESTGEQLLGTVYIVSTLAGAVSLSRSITGAATVQPTLQGAIK